MDAVELQRLLIKEVSGVDDPANELPGWMVQKASKFKTSLPIGPDQTWDASAAEKRVRAATKADDGPTPAYAACFLWFDSEADDDDKDGVPDNYGDYKFLVVDEVDGKLQVMPQALRAAASRLPQSSLSAADKTSVGNTLKALEKKAGIGEDATKAAAEDAPNMLARIKDILGLSEARKDADDMTADELNAALDARDETLVKSIGEAVAEAVAKSVAPAEGAAGAGAGGDGKGTEVPEGAVALTTEALTEIVASEIAKAQEGTNAILEGILNRVENTEKAFGIVARTSLDGQESGAGDGEGTATAKSKETPTATVKSAVAAALRNPGKPVYLAGRSSGGAAAL